MKRVAVALQLVALVAVPVSVLGLWGGWWALLVLGVLWGGAGVQLERELT